MSGSVKKHLAEKRRKKEKELIRQFYIEDFRQMVKRAEEQEIKKLEEQPKPEGTEN